MKNYKIVISKTFLKEYKKIYGNTETSLLVQNIFSTHDIEGIYIKRPFLKLKTKFNNIHIRLLGEYTQEKAVLFPLFIYKKSDKKFGQNLTWKSIKDSIDLQLQKVEKDIQNGDYKAYSKNQKD